MWPIYGNDFPTPKYWSQERCFGIILLIDLFLFSFLSDKLCKSPEKTIIEVIDYYHMMIMDVAVYIFIYSVPPAKLTVLIKQ